MKKFIKFFAVFVAGVAAGVYNKEIRTGVTKAYSAAKEKFTKCDSDCATEKADDFEAVK